jgi:hypothetical protein
MVAGEVVSMPLWTINLTLWHPHGYREVEMRVAAVSSRAALMKAIARVRLRPGELFHSMHVHIGAPHRRDPRMPRYRLSELLTNCDPSAPVNETAQEWLDAPRVGREEM